MYYDAWDEDLVEALAAPFAAGDHKDKRQGGQTITFVDVHKYKERLNATVGPHGWSCALRLEPIGGKLIATVALTVLGVTKENVGDEVEVPEVNERGNEKIIGGPATNSYAQAFKRACSDFGLGAYLYDATRREAAKRGGPAPSAPRQSPPAPRQHAAAAGTITEPQRKRLFAISKEHAWPAEAVKLLLVQHFDGITSTNDIPRSVYDEVCTSLADHDLRDGLAAELNMEMPL
jgi:hypothetical protein